MEHHGEFFDFGAVSFEPKPVQDPHPPLLVGGESPAALTRAARAEGWIGLQHTAESVAAPVETLRRRRDQLPAGTRRARFSVTVGATVSDPAELDAYAAAGVDRLIVSPWARTREVIAGLEAFARRFLA